MLELLEFLEFLELLEPLAILAPPTSLLAHLINPMEFSRITSRQGITMRHMHNW